MLCAHTALPLCRTFKLPTQNLTLRQYTQVPHWQILAACIKAITKRPTDYRTLELLNKQSDDDKNDLLRYIVRNPDESPEAVLALLKAGAQLNAPDARGKTALHYLADTTRVYVPKDFVTAVLEYCKEYNPDFEKKDRMGEMPARYASADMRYKFK